MLVEKDTIKQFWHDYWQMEIDIKTSSMAQEKRRVEWMFYTIQSHPTVHMRLDNIYTIEESNEFLYSTDLKLEHSED